MGDQAYSGAVTIIRMNLDGTAFEVIFEAKDTPDGEGALAVTSGSFGQNFPSAPLPPVPTPIATPSVDIIVTLTQQDCGKGWSRLFVGKNAILLPGDPNFVRSEPRKGNNVIGKLYPGAVVKVIGGPACADDLVFWKVESATIPGGSGWTAEGDGKVYWLEPLD